jgi:hypothetical protein
MRSRFIRSFGLVAVAGLAVACGESSSPSGAFNPSGDKVSPVPAAETPGAGAVPSTMPTEQVDAQVLKAYADYQRAYRKAYEANDPTRLTEVAMDPLLATVTKDIERVRAKGEIWRFANVSNAKVYARSADGLNVYVVDCMRTIGAYRYSARTGERLGGGTGAAYLYRTAVTYRSGVWKVSNTKRDRPC